MVQVIEQTREEKIAMYMKLSKKELAEMLVNCNVLLESMAKGNDVDGCDHEYPSPWFSITPPHCLKCGKQAFQPQITFSTFSTTV